MQITRRRRVAAARAGMAVGAVLAPLNALAALLLSEDFSCRSLGCNATLQPTNYSLWRWSTTGSAQAYLGVHDSGDPARGSEVSFAVEYCDPPSPNPTHLGCYRSEFALQRSIQDSLIDWKTHVGSSVRWFGFANRLPDNYTADCAHPEQGPSLQIHGGGGTAALKGQHPVLNLQVDATGCCSSEQNATCPRWAVSVQAEPNRDYDRRFDLGAVVPGRWEDWVVRAVFSPNATRGSLAVWRNGRELVPETTLATAYDDDVAPYLKFGVYKGGWKELSATKPTAQWATIAYSAMKVGDETASFDEVSTAPRN